MKRILILACSAALILTASPLLANRPGHHARFSNARAANHNAVVGRSWNGARNWSASRNWNASRNRNASGNWNGSRNWNRSRNWNHWSGNNWRRHCHRNRFVFIGSFGYPFFGYYPYYGSYYPYGYSSYYPYDYSYSDDGAYSGDAGYYRRSGAADGANTYNGGGASIVVQVQRQLSRDGFYQGAIDGVMGSRTQYAIRAYERSHGLPVDGEIDNQLLGTMGLR